MTVGVVKVSWKAVMSELVIRHCGRFITGCEISVAGVCSPSISAKKAPFSRTPIERERGCTDFVPNRGRSCTLRSVLRQPLNFGDLHDEPVVAEDVPAFADTQIPVPDLSDYAPDRNAQSLLNKLDGVPARCVFIYRNGLEWTCPDLVESV
jgi:hypothetical protein